MKRKQQARDGAGEAAASEFPRIVPIPRLGASGVTTDITADAGERAALARRFAMPAIDSLTATVLVTAADTDGVVRLSARFTATVVQTCVVTLKPVTADLEESFEIFFAPILTTATAISMWRQRATRTRNPLTARPSTLVR